MAQTGLLEDVAQFRRVRWVNPACASMGDVCGRLGFSYADLLDASDRLNRFRPLLKLLFPETGEGVIESPLTPIPAFARAVRERLGLVGVGTLLLKRDSELPIAGSVKARGGIYEVLCFAERLARERGMLALSDDYAVLADAAHRELFSRYTVAVGSTGNLGISVGVMAAALGFRAQVHMSRDAKQWKKDLLREKGAQVIEYDDDYGKAVAAGRARCENDPLAYFVDDENSRELFLGYGVAALRLKGQLERLGVEIGPRRRLIVHLPCGVGGAPCGIAFGLRTVFGDDVRCSLVEPTHAPCMLLALLTGRDGAHIREYGIDGLTEADGLAVGTASRLAAGAARLLVHSARTVQDDDLFRLLALLYDEEGLRVEPSAAAGLYGALAEPANADDVQIAWATGGLLLPDEVFHALAHRGRTLLR